MQIYLFLLPKFINMSLFQPFNTIYHESLAFFLHPQVYWRELKSGTRKNVFGFRNFLVPGLIIGFVCIVLGDLIFHSKNGFFWQDSLVKACRKTLFIFMLLTFSVMITKFVLGQFHFELKMKTARKIAVISLAPAVLKTVITGLLPFLDLGGVLPWYGFFLAYFGFETFFVIPDEKKFYFYFALFMAIFSLIMFLTFILNRISAHILL